MTRTYKIIHHMYNDDGNLHVWNEDGMVVCATETSVIVYVHDVPVLKFFDNNPNLTAGILANLIFNTNKEYAS